MSILEILLFFTLGIWIVLHLDSIGDNVREIKYEQHEIYLLLEYYLQKKYINEISEMDQRLKKLEKLSSQRFFTTSDEVLTVTGKELKERGFM